MIRQLWLALVALVLTVLFGSEVILWRVLRLPGLERRCRDRPRRWARAILRAAGVRVELEGVERFEPGRSRILVANHQSWFDVFVLTAFLPGDYRFVAKKELTRIPFFGPAWQACGHVAIDRGDRAAAIGSLTRAARHEGEEGVTIVIFPEGTRSTDGSLQPFKKGAFVLAIQTGFPVLPTAIVGSRAVMAKGSFRVHPGTIRVRFGEELSPEGKTHADRGEFAALAREEVARLIG